ncbi:MAG: hemerythrin domain-containing protein [Peptococcaceae bacterium]|nr:hemerythrin domain-containing protein [Peptococcaceae bacterium]
MDWLKRFHDDHAAIVLMLSKLEGNLRDIEHGEAGGNVLWELKEFSDMFNHVVVPHFKEEEVSVYPRLAAGAGEELSKLVDSLYEEHNQLYEAFDGFAKSFQDAAPLAEMQDNARLIAAEINRSANAERAEVPKNFNELCELCVDTPFDTSINVDKENLLKYSFFILEVLADI